MCQNIDEKDEELIGVLMAISVVSKHLAGKLIRLSRTGQSEKGGCQHEHDEEDGHDCH